VAAPAAGHPAQRNADAAQPPAPDQNRLLTASLLGPCDVRPAPGRMLAPDGADERPSG